MGNVVNFEPMNRAPVTELPRFGWHGEADNVTVHDVEMQASPRGHVIVFANEKGGTGKSTLAFHTAIALCDAGNSVAAIDLDGRQQSLGRALANRDATARGLRIDLPRPRHTVAHPQQSASMLVQEMARIGWHSDYFVIDVAGHDSALARRAIAMADTLVTPVNGSFVDLDLLGRIGSDESVERGCFGELVAGLRDERARRGDTRLDWVVLPNRVRHGSNNQARFAAALDRLSDELDFRVGEGLAERVAYRELFGLGLTHLDLRRIPDLPRVRSLVRQEILRLVQQLDLPPMSLFAAR